jgi:hypothetical protein
METTQEDLQEIARLIQQGFTSGLLEREEDEETGEKAASISWELSIEIEED